MITAVPKVMLVAADVWLSEAWALSQRTGLAVPRDHERLIRSLCSGAPDQLLREHAKWFLTPSAPADAAIAYAVPKGATFCTIYVVGAGSGGGQAHTANPAGGGGGGGGGGAARYVFPARLLPPVLYVRPGLRGRGATGGGSSGVGGLSGVMIDPTATIGSDPANTLVISGAAVATQGGGSTTGASAGAAGTASAVTTAASQAWAQLGIGMATAGQAGGAGGASNSNGGAVSPNGNAVTGGGGGAGLTVTNRSGGTVSPSGLTAGYTVGNGNRGLTHFSPFWGTGGAGGNSNNAGTGTSGGHGGVGSGGGGSGASSNSVLADGGDGGDGAVLIVWS